MDKKITIDLFVIEDDDLNRIKKSLKDGMCKDSVSLISATVDNKRYDLWINANDYEETKVLLSTCEDEETVDEEREIGDYILNKSEDIGTLVLNMLEFAKSCA